MAARVTLYRFALDQLKASGNLLYKAEKPSVCLFVHHTINSIGSAWIHIGLVLCRIVVSGMCMRV